MTQISINICIHTAQVFKIKLVKIKYINVIYLGHHDDVYIFYMPNDNNYFYYNYSYHYKSHNISFYLNKFSIGCKKIEYKMNTYALYKCNSYLNIFNYISIKKIYCISNKYPSSVTVDNIKTFNIGHLYKLNIYI